MKRIREERIRYGFGDEYRYDAMYWYRDGDGYGFGFGFGDGLGDGYGDGFWDGLGDGRSDPIGDEYAAD